MNVFLFSFVIMSYILYPGNTNFKRNEISCNMRDNSRVLVGTHSFAHDNAKEGGYLKKFPKFNYISKPQPILRGNKWKHNKPRSKI